MMVRSQEERWLPRRPGLREGVECSPHLCLAAWCVCVGRWEEKGEAGRAQLCSIPAAPVGDLPFCFSSPITQGIENPGFEVSPPPHGMPEAKARPPLTYVAQRQPSESGRHLLSEPNTPLSPLGPGDIFFPSLGEYLCDFQGHNSKSPQAILLEKSSQPPGAGLGVKGQRTPCSLCLSFLLQSQSLTPHILSSSKPAEDSGDAGWIWERCI